jgi:putative transcriptional regulator
MTIKELRKSTNLSQSKFAKKFGVSVGTLAHWEQGVRTPPSYVVSMMETILEYEKKKKNTS